MTLEISVEENTTASTSKRERIIKKRAGIEETYINLKAWLGKLLEFSL